MKARVQHVDIPYGRRIIAISDIHGNYDYFKGLLEKIRFSKDDILFLVGDIIEKGPQSLKTLRLVRELMTTHTVYAACGNVDWFRLSFLLDQSEDAVERFKANHLWSKSFWGGGLYWDMLDELHITSDENTDYAFVIDQLWKNYRDELEFIQNLPTIIETEKFIFVHGGLRGKNSGGIVENTALLLNEAAQHDAMEYLKYDNFYEEGFAFDRYLVVGHWPLSLYCSKAPCLNPILDMDRKILSIDGGSGIKKEGQLNALIIDDIRTCGLSYISYTSHPKVTALENQPESPDATNIPWTRNDIVLLEPFDSASDYTWVVQKCTGRRVRIPAKRILHVDENGVDAKCNDSTDYEPEVMAGDSLYLLDTMPDGILVNKDGYIGWYRKTYKL